MINSSRLGVQAARYNLVCNDFRPSSNDGFFNLYYLACATIL
jgi:hypothetical protein